MAAEKIRQRGLIIHRPVIYGNTAVPLTPEEKELGPPEHTHRWTVALRSPAPGKDSESVGGADDLSYFIKRVTFKLHDTYSSPNRNVDKPPFEVSETGWGEFEIQIRITFIAESGEKPLAFHHHLKLHPWSAVPTIEKDDVANPPDRTEPVHSWQYDEIVFTDPFQSFLNILLQYPPTPLPKTTRKPLSAGSYPNAFLTGKMTPEFTQNIEREESDRLEKSRKSLISQGEEWRQKLIQKENELQALKRQLEES